MELLTRAVGPVDTNVYLLADTKSGEAIAVDTATPCLVWLTGILVERGWRLKMIVSTHGHWDHIGDNAAVQAWAREAPIAVHALDRHRLVHPQPLSAPFDIPPSIPAVELAEGGRIKFGDIVLEVLHIPGHTEGSVGLLETSAGLLFSGDTLFAGSWGRTDFPGGSEEQMVESLGRLAGLPDALQVLPGHGAATTIGREREWLDEVKRAGRLPI